VHFLKYTFLACVFVATAACAQNTQSGSNFTVPNPTIEERNEVLARYDYLDPQNIVPSQSLAEAVLYFDKNKTKIANKNYLAVIDFNKNSRDKRFYIINMTTGAVWNIHVAHGKGSDPDFDGYARSFSNVSGSNATSLGYYVTAETYSGDHGLSLRLDGLSTTNSNARDRAIVIHGASYVQEADRVQGRSWGCPAVAMENRDRVVSLLKNGALIYATLAP
jgi:hypothetical protein